MENHRADGSGEAIDRLRNRDRENIDWAKIYYRIQTAGIADRRFWRDAFGNQPISVIAGCLEEIDRRDRETRNNALLPAAYALSYWGCKNAFEILFEDTKQEPKEKLSVQTIEVLKRLMAENKIPRKVVGILGSVNLLEEINGA